jgi:hypothetical protein
MSPLGSLDLDFNHRLSISLRQRLLWVGLTATLSLVAAGALAVAAERYLDSSEQESSVATQVREAQARLSRAQALARAPKPYATVAIERILPEMPLEPALHQLELLGGPNSLSGGTRLQHVVFKAGQAGTATLVLADEGQVAAMLAALCSGPSSGRWELEKGSTDGIAEGASAIAAFAGAAARTGANGPAVLPPQLPPPPSSVSIPVTLPAIPLPAGSAAPGSAKPWRVKLTWHPESKCTASEAP